MKIVLSGGPCGGKTTITQSLKREFFPYLKVVPETATMLYSGGFSRFDDPECRWYQQKAIFSVQECHEKIMKISNSREIIVCDRGTLDGVAYLDESLVDKFLAEMGTSIENEYLQYDYVIFLSTPIEKLYSTHANSIRVENFKQAWALNERLRKIWGGHKNFLNLDGEISFPEKVKRVHELVKNNLAFYEA